MTTRTAIVIGAGVAGLGAAIHLARSGLQVRVVEKNAGPGGRCDHFTRQGHRFDTGPTLLIMPQVYEAEFAAFGANFRECLDLKAVDPTYHIVFDDGNRLALTADGEALQAQLEAMEPGSSRGFREYMREGRRHYEVAMKRLVDRDFRKASDFFSIANLPLLYQVKPLVRHYANMGNYFASPRLKAAFTFQDVYMGLSPFEAPATFSMMSYTELAHGCWYPRGGMYSVVQALAGLARESGVRFVFNAPVRRVDVDDSRASGVILENGERLNADVILANADLPYVLRDLLPADALTQNVLRKRSSCSVISFFWGVDRPYDELPPHSLFLADDYRENFDTLIRDLDLPRNPSLYIHAPRQLDPSVAPPGEDTLIAIVPVGHLNGAADQDWPEIRERARREVFRRLRSLGITDLEQHIKFEVTYNPHDWQSRYNLVRGSTHGLCHNLAQLAWFRPHNKHPRYRNLYFAGASTHPGTGVPTALISGRLAAQRITDEWPQG
jgi:phytoene desaturase